MQFTTIMHHSKLTPNFGTKWTIEAESIEDATAKADRIATRLQHGAKPSKRFGYITHTEVKPL